MAERHNKDVNRKVRQGCLANKRIVITCKVDNLIHHYNGLDSEQEQMDFIVNLSPDDFYIFAANNKLSNKQLQTVYYYNAHIYYNKAKYNFSKYYCYCNFFQKFITDWEKELLIKKLMRPKHAHMIDVAYKQLKFLKPHYETLQAGYLAHKLGIVN